MRLTPPQVMTLEQAIAYLADDELVEVTPHSIRLRKRLVDPNDRNRATRAAPTPISAARSNASSAWSTGFWFW